MGEHEKNKSLLNMAPPLLGAGGSFMHLPSLTAAAEMCYTECRSHPGGRCACRRARGRGKSGLHRATMPANGRAGRPAGKCHRNIPPSACENEQEVRAKWCGPSGLKVRAHRAVRRRRRRVNPIGSKAGRRGLSAFVLAWNGESATRLRTPLEARSNACPREMATQTQNPAYRVASQNITSPGSKLPPSP